MSITSREMTITPKIAKRWLEECNYEDNRPISDARVVFYTRQMTQGRWVNNGTPIVFCPAGILLNGQHRLTAVVKSGVSIKTMVTKGIDPSTFTTMDQGFTRTAGQVLKMKGYSSNTVRAAICRQLYRWETTNGELQSSNQAISADEVILVQECYPVEIDNTVIYINRARKNIPMACGLFGLGTILLKRAKPRKSDEFLQVLDDGLTMVKGHPALTFRNKIIKEKMRDRPLVSIAQFALFIRAWNFFSQGKKVSTLTVRRNEKGLWTIPSVHGLGKKATMGAL